MLCVIITSLCTMNAYLRRWSPLSILTQSSPSLAFQPSPQPSATHMTYAVPLRYPVPVFHLEEANKCAFAFSQQSLGTSKVRAPRQGLTSSLKDRVPGSSHDQTSPIGHFRHISCLLGTHTGPQTRGLTPWAPPDVLSTIYLR